MPDYADIRRALSARRLQKYGPPVDGDTEQWLKQMDEAAQDLGLPNVYRTHPYTASRKQDAT